MNDEPQTSLMLNCRVIRRLLAFAHEVARRFVLVGQRRDAAPVHCRTLRKADGMRRSASLPPPALTVVIRVNSLARSNSRCATRTTAPQPHVVAESRG